MAKWLPSFGHKEEAQGPKTVLELMVVEGAAAGQQFTVDGPEVRIGRGKPKTGQTGAILLHDTSVSSLQATIRQERGGAVLEHNRSATNPTLVNGHRIKKQKITPGDHIRMGLCVIEVRQRKGIALSGLFRVSDATQPLDLTDAEARVAARAAPTQVLDQQATAEMEAVREDAPTLTTLVERGALVVTQGLPELENERFPIGPDVTVIGRSAQCDVSLAEPGISRRHARCEWQGDALVLYHLSETNSTCVNGARVTGSCALRDGDEVRLADQVVLRVELGTPGRGPRTEERPTLPPASRTPSLRQFMEEKLEHDQLIEEQFSVVGSFVDLDVVGSYKMKAEAARPAHIIVSFERFRSFVGRVVVEFGGQVLNSNGDELMCFFESTHDAVRSASAILERLARFNEAENVLTSPFRFRIGVHTGRSLVDRERGIAYSEVLDIAGHLQKAADVNGLLISEETLAALPEGLPFESAGVLEREGIETYRATGPIP